MLLLSIQAKHQLENKSTPGVVCGFSSALRLMFSTKIVPFLTEKNDESMPISLRAFRDKFVWIEEVNQVLDLNLEGIM